MTFTPTDDATIRESQPDRAYGTRTALEVDANSKKDILLRFDVSGVGAASVASTTLRLYNVDSSPMGGTFTVVTDSGWSENTVTWNNAPAGDGPISIRISSTEGNGADYASTENGNGNAPELVIVTQWTSDPPECRRLIHDKSGVRELTPQP